MADPFSQSDVGIAWADCFAGPADGQDFPVDMTDMDLELPYLHTPEQAYYWYRLYRARDAPGVFRYVLRGVEIGDQWIAV
jgi:hypothetical protein